MDSLVREWTHFLDRCIELRVRADLFDAAAVQLHITSPLPGRKIAALLLKPRTPAAISFDPRVVVYAERLLALKKIDASDLLSSAFQYSKDRPARQGEEHHSKDPSPWQNPPELEEILFHRLHKAFSGERVERPTTNTEGFRTLCVVTAWMSAMVTSHTSDSMIQALAGIQQHPQQQSINVREALGMLVVGLIENAKVLQLLNKVELKEVRKQFAQALSTFIPFLSQTSIQIANRLEIYQKEHDFHDKSVPSANEDGSENAVAALHLEAVIEIPMINTRAGLYVFLHSLLVARPLTDDILITSYINSRYKMDAQTMATDLVTAAFDILANAMYRNEPSQTMDSLKSFLVNKIPLLLSQYASPMYAMNPELCITQALSHVDPNAFPAFSQGFDIMGGNNALSDVRQDFLNACALHGLIQTSTVERLLGETPMQGPPETKYVKQNLIAQCKENFERVYAYIEELENLDGNAGAIVGAVTEFISHLCETQMTMHLKNICNLLSKKSQALDTMLQFTSPVSILKPLCIFLDEWRYDGDQGEYQPVYDEFGAILILVMAFVHRYNLTHYDLGIEHNSFVAQLLESGYHSVPPNDLTEDQGKHLGSWLRDLYDSDKEGLSNEVFASCRPQDFYLIVPTLFSQTVMACSADVLSLESVKGGLEYLHETFLLPALVGGLTWMASHALLSGHQDLDVLMQMFGKLIRSTPTSGDAQAMHSTILCVVSPQLKKCFRTLKRRHPNRTDIEPLLQAIKGVKGNLHYERSVYSSIAELEQWTSASNSTLISSLRQTVQQLSQWASSSALQPNPPSYTHRQIYTCIELVGASKTLRAIVDEIKAQTEAGNGAAALDIGVSIICAPMVDNSTMPVNWPGSSIPASPSPRTRINLREALQVEFDDAPSIVSTDPLAAETIVRLHRRVEGLFADLAQAAGIPTGNAMLSTVNLADVPSQDLPADLDKAMNDAAAGVLATGNGDLSSMEGIDMDLNKQGLNRTMDDLDLTAAGVDLSSIGVGTGGMSTDIQMGDLPDLNLDDMGDMGDMGMGADGDDWGLDFTDM